MLISIVSNEDVANWLEMNGAMQFKGPQSDFYICNDIKIVIYPSIPKNDNRFMLSDGIIFIASSSESEKIGKLHTFSTPSCIVVLGEDHIGGFPDGIPAFSVKHLMEQSLMDIMSKLEFLIEDRKQLSPKRVIRDRLNQIDILGNSLQNEFEFFDASLYRPVRIRTNLDWDRVSESSSEDKSDDGHLYPQNIKRGEGDTIDFTVQVDSGNLNEVEPIGYLMVDIIKTITNPDTFDFDIAKVIIFCYPKFLAPAKFLDCLVDRIDQASIEVTLKIINTIQFWLKNYAADFDDKMRFTVLVIMHIYDKIPKLSPFIQQLGNLLLATSPLQSCSWGFLPPLILESTETSRAETKLQSWLLDIDSRVLAEQLTLLEWETFSLIEPREYLQQIWAKHPHGKKTRNLARSVNHFNFLSSFVTTSILIEKTAKLRAKMISKWMRIARWTRSMNNYKTLMAIILGIKSSPIFRLKQTWKFLNQREHCKEFELLERLMSSERSFAEYREALKKSVFPSIPYFGIFQRDLIYLDEISNDTKEDGTINFSKFAAIGEIILSLESFRLQSYPFVPNESLLNKFKNSSVFEEKEAFQISLELEPRR